MRCRVLYHQMRVVPDANILDCFFPSATLISAVLIPSDSRIAALFFLSASTCICMASWTLAGIRMSLISYLMQVMPQAVEAYEGKFVAKIVNS